MTIPEQAVEAAALVRELRDDGNSWAQPLFNRAADMIEVLSTLPPLRAREEIARWQATKTKLLEFHSTFLSRTSQDGAPFFLSVDQYEAQRLTDALLDASLGLEEATQALSRTAGQEWTSAARRDNEPLSAGKQT